MRHYPSDQFLRIVLFASILGCAAGLAEGSVDIASGTVITSGWLPENFQLPATSKALYIVFNAAPHAIFFQVAASECGSFSNL